MRVKVVHIITRLDLGGAQQNTLYTVGHLDPERFEVVLACGSGGILDREAAALEGGPHPVRVRFFPDLMREVNPLRDFMAFLQLWAFLYSERPAIVHTHSSKAGILGRLAARLAGVPLILHTYHGFGFHDRMRAWLRAVYVALERSAARYSTRLIFVSQANRAQAELLGLGEKERYLIIRSGVRLADFPAKIPSKAEKKAALGLRMHKPLVVGVGNLKAQKNPEDFLKAAERALQGAPEASFFYVGDGPARSRLQAEAIGKKLRGKVFFPGWRRDVGEILAAADVFALTSLWEGLPRSLVEAMKSGLPCVCYAVDGIRDVIQDGVNGFLVPAGDWEALAARVAELLADPALKERLGQAAARSIGPEFDIDNMVKAQEALYDELLTRWAGPSSSPLDLP